MKNKIIFLSDTHGRHNEITNDLLAIANKDDILVHAGDFTGRGEPNEVFSFFTWLTTMSSNFKHIVFIAGNHELSFERKSTWVIDALKQLPINVHYLEDSEITLDGIKFYGSPWQPEFYNWAFNLPRGEELAKKWALIPDDTDVLITHGPPFGILDTTLTSFRPGCDDLLIRVNQIKPKIHVFGHIHYGYGMRQIDNTTFINAANLNEAYKYANHPIDFEINF